jgi:hypothetical protein
MIVWNCWKELPMPLAVINRVDLLGHAKCSLLVFTDRHGQVIGDYTPTSGKTDDTDASVLSAVIDLNSPVPPVPSEMPEVFLGEEGSADELPGMEAHDVAVIPAPTGVDLGGSQPEPPQVEAIFDNAAFDTAVNGGPEQQAVAEINQAAPPEVGMAALNACIRNPPKQYVPNMQGNKYQVALDQITTSLGMSETSMAFAHMSVKLMSNGIHQRADIVGIVMAQVLLKTALKKWGREAEESVGKEMKQLH